MAHSDPDPDNNRNWLADAMGGDFSTMPNPFTWDQSAPFADFIDGYGFAGGVSECMEISRNAIDSEPDPDDRAGGAMLLWVALFGEHPRYPHGGYPPPPRSTSRLYLDLLCETLRSRLQMLDPGDRERLLAVVAKHSSSPARRLRILLEGRRGVSNYRFRQILH